MESGPTWMLPHLLPWSSNFGKVTVLLLLCNSPTRVIIETYELETLESVVCTFKVLNASYLFPAAHGMGTFQVMPVGFPDTHPNI